VPDYYVRSTDGNNADDGSTWALAKADVNTPTWAAGDRIFVSDNHAQTSGGGINITLNGTRASPVQVLCVDDSAEPPTTLAATATIFTTSASNINISGYGYFYGFHIRAGSGGSNVTLTLGTAGDNLQIYENCKLENGSTGGSGFTITIGNGASALPSMVELIDCEVAFNGVNSTLRLVNGTLHWRGGTLTGTAIVKLLEFGTNARAGIAYVDGVDLSAGASTMALAQFNQGAALAVFRNCKLPASWTGNPSNGYAAGCRVEMYNCDSADTNYRLWIEDIAGSTKSETVVVRTGGADDGTTPLSWKIDTKTDAEYPTVKHASPEIVQWNETTGSSVTATVEIVHDSQGAGSGSKFQDDEIWLEVMYLGTSGFPLGVWISDCKADVLATAANQADSTESWTTTGLTTPVTQKLSVTFTAQEKGFVHARVVMAKASKTAYICPKMTVA
jgi:hypothetical protein